MTVQGAGDRLGRGEDDLAEHDDREELVALGDVVPVPGGAPPVLGPERRRHLDQGEGHEGHPAGSPVAEDEDAQHPEDLDDRDRPGVAQRRATGLGVFASHPQPERDHRHPHDHVADHDQREVVVRAGRLGCARRQDEDPGHHHEGE